jgi:hypothetical protein
MIVLKRLLTFMAVVLAMAHSSAQADPTILNVDTPTAVANGTAFIGDGFIASGFFQGAAGSGNIDPFLRLGTNDTFERGYNTSLGLPLDDKPPQPGFTHALQLSAVPIVNIGGVNYREFLLDANQTNNGNISLNQVQIFQSSADVGGSSTSFSLTEATASTNAVISFPGSGANLIFQMSNPDATASNANVVQINSGNGSGTLDMALYVKDSLFTNTDPNSFVTLFSQFGTPPSAAATSFAANDGFEEWKVRELPPVPEPSTMAIGVLGALGFLAYGLRRRLKK